MERPESARAEFDAIKKRIEAYVMENAEARACLIREGHINQVLAVLSAEMALAGAHGHLQTVSQLAGLAESLVHSEATLRMTEARDYSERFDDSTQVFTGSLPGE